MDNNEAVLKNIEDQREGTKTLKTPEYRDIKVKKIMKIWLLQLLI